MAKSKNPVQMQLQVTLTPEAFEFLQRNAKEGDLAGTLAGWTSYWASQQAGGGIMLEPADSQYLAELNGGKKFKDSRSLVTAVEKGLKRESGQFSFTINVDPAYVQPLQEQAVASAMTTEELINGVIDMVILKGWLWDFSPADGKSIPFTRAMLDATANLCEKHMIDSSDVTGLIAEERFIPISRDMKAKAKALNPDKLDFTAGDLEKLLDELAVARKELAELRVAPRELVAA